MLRYCYNAYKLEKYIERGGERELIQLNSTHQDKVIISTLWRLSNGLEVCAQIPESQVNADVHTQSYGMIGSMNKPETNHLLRGNTTVPGNWSLTILLLGFTKLNWAMLSNGTDMGL